MPRSEDKDLPRASICHDTRCKSLVQTTEHGIQIQVVGVCSRRASSAATYAPD